MAYNDGNGAQKGSTRSSTQQDKADAFLNVVLVDKTGKEHPIKGGIALRMDNQMHRTIINKVKEEPDLQIKLLGSVHIVNEDDGSDLELDI